MKTRNVILSTMVAGLVGFGLATAKADDAAKTGGDAAKKKEFECKGGNECKGKGDCGGPGYSCAGNNECRGKGWVYTESKEECDKLLAKVKAGGKAKHKKKG